MPIHIQKYADLEKAHTEEHQRAHTDANHDSGTPGSVSLRGQHPLTFDEHVSCLLVDNMLVVTCPRIAGNKEHMSYFSWYQTNVHLHSLRFGTQV